MVRKTNYDFYDDQFKATAVELGDLPGVKAKDVAEVLEIHPIMLYRWKKELYDGKIMKKSDKGTLATEEKAELKRLRKLEKAYTQLQMEHDLLKKASSTVRNEKRNLRIHRRTTWELFLKAIM